jgi:hypothetical protein
VRADHLRRLRGVMAHVTALAGGDYYSDPNFPTGYSRGALQMRHLPQ